MKHLLLVLFVLFLFVNLSAQTPAGTVTYGSKTYNVIQVGNKFWLKENLQIGSMIQSNQDMKNNNIIEKYYYDNDSVKNSKYGGLYTWNEAMQYKTTEKSRGICPPMWHVPTKTEYEELTKSYIGDIMSFTTLFSGKRDPNSLFYEKDIKTYFWTSTEYSSDGTTVVVFDNNTKKVYIESGAKSMSVCVRCIQDYVPPTDVNEDMLPQTYSLSQNYPNPFNPTTMIKYSVKSSGNVLIRITDVLGREVSVLVNEYKNVGDYSISFNGSNLSSGTYFYTIKVNDFNQTKKMILVK